MAKFTTIAYLLFLLGGLCVQVAGGETSRRGARGEKGTRDRQGEERRAKGVGDVATPKWKCHKDVSLCRFSWGTGGAANDISQSPSDSPLPIQFRPSPMPTGKPTPAPTLAPVPQFRPSSMPTGKPTPAPTLAPVPQLRPSSMPTRKPTPAPTLAPVPQSVISTNKINYAYQEDIVITWDNNGAVTGLDWIALFDSNNVPSGAATAPQGEELMWIYACGTQTCNPSVAASGSATFGRDGVRETGGVSWPLPAGNYKVVLLSRNSYNIIASSSRFTVSSISTDQGNYDYRERIIIRWDNRGAVSGSDWIGLYRSSDIPPRATTAPEGNELMWVYACGTQNCSPSSTASGSVTFGSGGIVETGDVSWPLSPGNYKVVLLRNDSYRIITSSDEFTVDEESGCPRICLDVSQEGTSVGTFQPVSTPETIVQFYGYNNDNYSFNGDDVVPLVPDYSLIFIHEDSNRCNLALVIVHDSKQENTGGEVIMFISGNLENAIVQDGRDSPSDSYIYNARTDETECWWEWSWQNPRTFRTDGIAHSWRPSQRRCLSVSPDFVRGIDEWQFVSGPVNSNGRVRTRDYITLDMNRDLRICETSC